MSKKAKTTEITSANARAIKKWFTILLPVAFFSQVLTLIPYEQQHDFVPAPRPSKSTSWEDDFVPAEQPTKSWRDRASPVGSPPSPKAGLKSFIPDSTPASPPSRSSWEDRFVPIVPPTPPLPSNEVPETKGSFLGSLAAGTADGASRVIESILRTPEMIWRVSEGIYQTDFTIIALISALIYAKLLSIWFEAVFGEPQRWYRRIWRSLYLSLIIGWMCLFSVILIMLLAKVPLSTDKLLFLLFMSFIKDIGQGILLPVAYICFRDAKPVLYNFFHFGTLSPTKIERGKYPQTEFLAPSDETNNNHVCLYKKCD